MATAEERMRVLKMIEEGKISAKEGARLLGALGRSDEQARRQRGTAEAGGEGGGRWLRLRVSDTRSGKTRVNLTIPIGLVNMGLQRRPLRPSSGSRAKSLWAAKILCAKRPMFSGCDFWEQRCGRLFLGVRP